MADIELVINIPEDIYNEIKEKHEISAEKFIRHTAYLEFAVENGTLLPKGHGRLIDVNDLLDDISLEDNDYNRDVNVGEIITLENIDRIPTIIEADKGE